MQSEYKKCKYLEIPEMEKHQKETYQSNAEIKEKY